MNGTAPLERRRSSRIRVVVVEDSLVQRAHLVGVLEADGDIVVVGEAATAAEAIAVVAQFLPQVVTLDLQIPGGGGQHVLEEIMASTPTPVLVLSGIVHNDKSASAIEALVAGAVIAMPKPARWTAAIEHEVRRNVRMVHSVPVVRRPKGRLGSVQPTSPVTGAMPSAEGGTIVAIAASTGGPSALAVVLAGLVGLSAPVLIVQHLNADFVSGLVDWMTRVSPLPVILAVEGRTLRNGCVHIAPGGTHLRVAAGSRIELTSQPSTIHQPSANELFASVAERAGERGIGVLLTGMGEDGATGLAEMHRRGAQTIAQDEESCVVYGMPRAAVRLGAVGQLLPLHAIADAIMHAARARRVPG